LDKIPEWRMHLECMRCQWNNEESDFELKPERKPQKNNLRLLLYNLRKKLRRNAVSG